MGFAAPVKILIKGVVNSIAIVPAKVAKPPPILQFLGDKITRGAVAACRAVFDWEFSHCS
jgi:hypothetical protein